MQLTNKRVGSLWQWLPSLKNNHSKLPVPGLPVRIFMLPKLCYVTSCDVNQTFKKVAGYMGLCNVLHTCNPTTKYWLHLGRMLKIQRTSVGLLLPNTVCLLCVIICLFVFSLVCLFIHSFIYFFIYLF